MMTGKAEQNSTGFRFTKARAPAQDVSMPNLKASDTPDESLPTGQLLIAWVTGGIAVYRDQLNEKDKG